LFALLSLPEVFPMSDPAATTPADADTHQTALAALLFMLSRYRRVPCARTHAAIVDHLARVAGDPRSTQALRQAATMLHREWATETAPTMAKPDSQADARPEIASTFGTVRGRLH